MPDELKPAMDVLAEAARHETYEAASAVIEADRLAVAEKVWEACADACSIDRIVSRSDEWSFISISGSSYDAYRAIRALDLRKLIGGDNGAD